jgi:hypothetical protein
MSELKVPVFAVVAVSVWQASRVIVSSAAWEEPIISLPFPLPLPLFSFPVRERKRER